MLDSSPPNTSNPSNEWGKVANCWADLVRVECDDGNIVWTQPQHVESTKTHKIEPSPDDGGYNQMYWAKAAKP